MFSNLRLSRENLNRFLSPLNQCIIGLVFGASQFHCTLEGAIMRKPSPVEEMIFRMSFGDHSEATLPKITLSTSPGLQCRQSAITLILRLPHQQFENRRSGKSLLGLPSCEHETRGFGLLDALHDMTSVRIQRSSWFFNSLRDANFPYASLVRLQRSCVGARNTIDFAVSVYAFGRRTLLSS
jgi:hypothetical protein